jgi:hypothetical protein
MAHIVQDRQGLTDDRMGFPSLDVYDQTDPASVVLGLRVVQTLRPRSSNRYLTVEIVLSHNPIPLPFLRFNP